MNSPSDNVGRAQNLKRRIVQYETLAAHYRALLHDTSPSDDGLGPVLVQGPAPVDALLVRTCNASPLLDPAVPAGRISKRTGVMPRPRAVIQEEQAALPVNHTTSRAPEEGTLLQPSFAGFSPDQRLLPRGSPANRLLPSVQEDGDVPDVGVTPDAFLAKKCFDELSYLAMTGTNLSPSLAYSSRGPSACPSLVSGPSAVERSQPLTRHGSSFDGHSGANMLRLFSSQSWQTDASPGRDAMIYADGLKKRSTCDQDFLGLGAAFPADPRSHPSSSPILGTHLSPPIATENLMARSISNTSDASARSAGSSLERRSKQAFRRVLQNSHRNLIAPKPRGSLADLSSGSVAPSKKGGKVALEKTPYQRPKHPRVYCDQCDEYPGGFRGTNELRRHLDAKHKGVVKKFVCRDPASVGVESAVKALYPLAECRACTSKKQYGAYYNAVAHLRRTHFKPRAPRGKKKSPTDERRGGKGGGDWPPMADLRPWYEEVLIPRGTDTLEQTDQGTFGHGEDAALDMFLDLDSTPAVAGFGLPPCAEWPSPEDALPGDGELDYQASTDPFLDPSMAAHLCDATSQVTSGCLWSMGDAQDPFS